MIGPNSQSRREFLLALGALILLPASVRQRKGQLLRTDGARKTEWDDLVAEKRSWAVVGREYLRSFPEEAQPDRLIELVQSNWRNRGEGQSVYWLRERLGKQIRRDFERGETVQVQGWILARTEARVCALAVLL